MVKRSEAAVAALNDFSRDPAVIARIGRMGKDARVCLSLAVLLSKLNSGDEKAIEWASGLTRGPEDVA